MPKRWPMWCASAWLPAELAAERGDGTQRTGKVFDLASRASLIGIPAGAIPGGGPGGPFVVPPGADLFPEPRDRLRDFSRAAAYVTIPAILIGGLSLTF